jgi:hypothetical protein
MSTAIATLDDLLAALAPIAPESAPAERQYQSVPYVGFRGKKSFTRIEELDAAGIGIGEFYLNDVQPLAVRPMELHLLNVGRAYTIQDDDGKVIDARFSYDKEDPDCDDFREHLFAAVLVYQHPGIFTAATLSLRGAQCKALKLALELLEGRAHDPAKWSTASAGHKATAHARVAGGRFRVGIWNTMEKPQNGGQLYNLGHGRIVMPTAADTDAFNNYLANQFNAVATVIRVNTARLAKCRELSESVTA